MNKEEKLKLYDRVLKLGSIEHQDIKLAEELAELITEIIRIKTGRNKPNSKEIISELADSIIMIEQFIRNHNLDYFVKVVIDSKLKRLEKRVLDGGILEKQ